MNTLAVRYQELASVRTTRALATAIALLVLLGLVWANSGEQLLAYLLVLFAAVLPSVLWIRMGTLGIPIFPVVSLAYIPYFGWPVLSGSEGTLDYTAWEILRAALTVVLSLLSATVAWRLMAATLRSQRAIAPDRVDTSRVVQLVLVGLFVGVMFHIGIISGSLGWLGSLFGLARAVAFTLATVACFLIGVTRAQGILHGKAWVAAIAGAVLLVILSWSSLLLVGGTIYSLAVVFGYVIVAKRMPWLLVGTVLVVVTVLQAGKAEMRERYRGVESSSSGVSKVMELPEFAAEWIAEGFAAITSDKGYVSPLDRTGLLHMILLVQSETPDRIDYLRGETYSLLPAILVPRFIDSDRPASQVGMDLLNIHYGLLTAEDAAATAIGWGLVAEAYANFGYLGVIGIALLLGALCGGGQSWSSNAAIMSLPTLTSIALMMTLINIELDFIQVCSILLQSFAAVLIFLAAFRSLAVR